MKSFKFWKWEEVQDTFGLKRTKQSAPMQDWLTVDRSTLTNEEKEELENLRSYLDDHLTAWNEAALKMLFLGPLMRLVNFHHAFFNPFMEHKLTAKVGTETTSGLVDLMVARGEQIPKTPIFCLHEYKPEEGTSNDPYGQLLIAMVAAQQVNVEAGHDTPIYGTYVLGGNFYFVILDGVEYGRSQPYIATQDDIFDLFLILRKTKVYMTALV